MNKQIEKFSRQIEEFSRNTLKKGLVQLPESNQLLFKRMYSHKNLEADINDVVDSMPSDQLEWAMQQVHNSIHEGPS